MCDFLRKTDIIQRFECSLILHYAIVVMVCGLRIIDYLCDLRSQTILFYCVVIM